MSNPTLKEIPSRDENIKRYRPLGGWRPDPEKLKRFINQQFNSSTFKVHEHNDDSCTVVVFIGD